MKRMKPITDRDVVLDALTLCYEVENPYHYEELKRIKIDEYYELYDFKLKRINGRYFKNVYTIIFYDSDTDKYKSFGHLKFNLNEENDEKNNFHVNGKPKVWITLENSILYSDELYYISYIDSELGLSPHNITTIDLAFDTNFDMAKKIKSWIKCRDLCIVLNGKIIRDRDRDIPEITYTTSGSCNKTEKYKTVNIKQKKAIHDKTKGTTAICYNKLAEIRNSSGKDYILAHYGNPNRLYRVEVHLNYEQIKDFFLGQENEWFRFYGFLQKDLREELFFEHLNRLIHFKYGKHNITWQSLLGKNAA